MNSAETYWYFSDDTETLRFGDGRKISVGVTHTVDCDPILCIQGLHASRSVFHALAVAPGPILWRVSLGGEIAHGRDKLCATERRYHARLDATDVLLTFARKCALQVSHIWNAPQIVTDYLTTGNDDLRSASHKAAKLAAMYANAVSNPTSTAIASAAFSVKYASSVLPDGSIWWSPESVKDTSFVVEAAYRSALYAASAAAWYADAANVTNPAGQPARLAAESAQREMLEQMVNEAMKENQS